jgi:hypothetical protein
MSVPHTRPLVIIPPFVTEVTKLEGSARIRVCREVVRLSDVSPIRIVGASPRVVELEECAIACPERKADPKAVFHVVDGVPASEVNWLRRRPKSRM